VFDQVVLSEASLEAHALLCVQVTVTHCGELKGALAVGDGVAETVGQLTLTELV